MPISIVIFSCPAFSVPLSIVKVRLALSGRPCNLATTASDVASIDFLFSFVSMSNLLLRSTSEFKATVLFLDTRLSPLPMSKLMPYFHRCWSFLYRDPVRYLRLVSLSGYPFLLSFPMSTTQVINQFFPIRSIGIINILIDSLVTY